MTGKKSTRNQTGKDCLSFETSEARIPRTTMANVQCFVSIEEAVVGRTG